MALAEQLFPLWKESVISFFLHHHPFIFQSLGNTAAVLRAHRFVKNYWETICVEQFEKFVHPFILFCLSGSRGGEGGLEPIPTIIGRDKKYHSSVAS